MRNNNWRQILIWKQLFFFKEKNIKFYLFNELDRLCNQIIMILKWRDQKNVTEAKLIWNQIQQKKRE